VEGVEVEGRTVNEAIDRALEELGLTRAEVTIEVLTEGRPRLLGFGGEPARVRVTPLAAAPAHQPPRTAQPAIDEYESEEEEEEGELPPELRRTPVAITADPEEVRVAVEVLTELLSLMGVEATVTPRAPETPGDGVGLIEAVLDIEGDDLGILIGRRGNTLASLQYILNLILAKRLNHRVAYGIDVDSYRRRREEALVTLAKRMAQRVRGTGRSVTLEPMPANERRIVHLTLAGDPAVMTVSIGEGEARKVAITPTR
jgi:spoIIIJ-associated protein